MSDFKPGYKVVCLCHALFYLCLCCLMKLACSRCLTCSLCLKEARRQLCIQHSSSRAGLRQFLVVRVIFTWMVDNDKVTFILEFLSSIEVCFGTEFSLTSTWSVATWWMDCSFYVFIYGFVSVIVFYLVADVYGKSWPFVYQLNAIQFIRSFVYSFILRGSAFCYCFSVNVFV